MTRRLAKTRLMAMAGVIGAMWSCTRSQQLERLVDAIEQTLIDAEEAGALRCAPRELAVARSHLEFAQLEREQGFASKAERHLEIAAEHARSAQLLSPSAHCGGRSAIGP